MPLHPAIAGLGPDLLADEPDLDEAVSRLLDPSRRSLTIGEALLDQTAAAGVGNVYRSEVLATNRVSPFVTVGDLGRDELERLVVAARDLLRVNVGGGERVTVPGASPRTRWVYGRAGRPCRRCGTLIRSMPIGEPPRRLYWCPRCQPPAVHEGYRSVAT